MGRNELWRTRRRESRAEKMNKHDVNEPWDAIFDKMNNWIFRKYCFNIIVSSS
jgi:hypothetical protein